MKMSDNFQFVGVVSVVDAVLILHFIRFILVLKEKI